MELSAIEIAEHYFKLSNARNLEEIVKLLTDSSTYSSQNTGVYIGVSQIMEMKRKFYGSFKEMHWDVSSVEEVRPGVVLFDFVFTGTTVGGEDIRRPGLEYVIVHNNKLQHIEVRNK